jgi:hypothetical protein
MLSVYIFHLLSVCCTCIYTPHFIPGLVSEGSSTQQCYMGICLPLDLASLYPRDEPATRDADVKERDCQRGNSERRRSTSLGEMKDLQEAGSFGCTFRALVACL